jgi:hypothetical protein
MRTIQWQLGTSELFQHMLEDGRGGGEVVSKWTVAGPSGHVLLLACSRAAE